uniref:Fibronectin type-III domain-containing protein n=1 Tax=Amphimedon queenslandica TaxID=400682 RepID=A0A1X7TH69_AMPQE
MATTGIYWCLVLVDLILLSSGAELAQTSPSYSPVCLGDKLVFTCTTNTGTVYWKIPGHNNLEEILQPTTINGLILEVTKVNSVVTSTATYQSINESLNGTLIGCIGEITVIGNVQFENLTIDVTDPPVAVNNISIIPINKYTMIINWLYQNPKTIQCIVNYTVIVNGINGPSQQNYSSTGNNPNITIDDLIIGTNYSFIIIPIDTIGREGPPSSLIQYIWNVPAQVVNISWNQISTDSITIWWNNTQDSNTSPPINNYTLIYNNNSQNTTNTNITITGLPLTDTNYTVTIIPVNVIGYGPSATVNGTVDYHTGHANIELLQ